jgi:hypothetical protein
MPSLKAGETWTAIKNCIVKITKGGVYVKLKDGNYVTL